MPRRVFKTAKVKLNEIVKDPKRLAELEMSFAQFEAQRQVAVEKGRLAVQAQAEFQKAQSEAAVFHQKFLLEVSQHSTEVASEPIWLIFRKDGGIQLESPFTERNQRNLLRAQMHLLDKSVHRDDDDVDTSGLFEDDTQENDNGGNVN